MDYHKIADEMAELRFYHPNNEVGEMFQHTIALLKYALIYDKPSRAQFLMEWAKEQAKRSEQYCFDLFGELDDDWITGEF